ncbi:hypothetical protein ACWDKQ_24075 [Saccharopolyspora sp. NPDC000995]
MRQVEQCRGHVQQIEYLGVPVGAPVAEHAALRHQSPDPRAVRAG